MKIVETRIPAGEVMDLKELSDGRWVVTHSVEEVVPMSMVSPTRQSIINDDNFVLINAESLSLDDEFMQHFPIGERQARLKAFIYEAIRSGVKNFYRPVMDPSLTDDRKGIYFSPGGCPAVGRSYSWWKDIAKKYSPQCNSRLGTKLEYAAFLGVLIKNLVGDNRGRIQLAWHAVCDDSCDLGHYRDSRNYRHVFETTGSRYMCGFYDLANTSKLLAEDFEAGGFWMVSGSHKEWGEFHNPIGKFDIGTDPYHDFAGSVGWIVLS